MKNESPATMATPIPVQEKVSEQVTVYCANKDAFDKECYKYYERGFQPAFCSFRHDINTGYSFVMILYKTS